MFKLHRNSKSDKSGERIDFKFSHFNALQVPKGWDKLLVSMISVETGKTVAKSGKALVRNGKCQWTENLSESIWVSHVEESLLKFVISMGSSRSGILGETIINLTNYASSKAYVPISVPLKKCDHGTTIQFKLQCLTPWTNIRNTKLQQTTSHVETTIEEHDDMDSRSDASDISYTRSTGSSSSNHLIHQGETGSRNTSFSASGSRNSFDSAEGSLDRINFSPRNSLSEHNALGSQESSGSPRNAIYANGSVDLPRSNHSSFNSKLRGLGNTPNTSSLRDAASTKDLLEDAENTIEDLRAEARMWERNARKVMTDVETLRKEVANQKRNHVDLNMELSASNSERDDLKKEIQQLKTLIEELKINKITTEKSSFRLEGVSNIQELESEMKFQKESNASLAHQLQKTQESNIELVSILQELEETIEKQRLELNNFMEVKTNTDTEKNRDGEKLGAEDGSNFEQKLQELQESHNELQATVKLLEETVEGKDKELELERNLRKKSILDNEAEWTSRLSTKNEYITKLETKLSDLQSAQPSHETSSVSEGNSDLTREIESLKAKVQELEKDCNELTDENLELLLKLKESSKDFQSGETFFNSSSDELQASMSPKTSDYEVELLRSQIYQLEQELKKKEGHFNGVTNENLKPQLLDLQSKYSNLEIQLQSFQYKARNLEEKLSNSQSRSESQMLEITTLKQQLQQHQGGEAIELNKLETVGANNSVEMHEFFQELNKQLHLVIAQVEKPWSVSDSNIEYQTDFDQDSKATDLISQSKQTEFILKKVAHLSKLLETMIIERQVELQSGKAVISFGDANVTEAKNTVEECSLKDSDLYLPTEEVDNLKPELVTMTSKIEELQTCLLLKEEEIETLRHCQNECEAQISNLQTENGQLEENLETVRNDMMVLSSTLDSHISSIKVLEKNTSELETGKCELELHLSELEEENVQLSERISGLEAQLRYFTNEKESSRLELENSKSLAIDLRNETQRLKSEMETQKVELKQKLQDMQKKWSEAQEECEYLRKANPKLQATAESLIDECSTNQTLNRELRKQNLELHEKCMKLEAELRESRKCFSECFEKIELLEAAYCSIQIDIASKEKYLNSELDVFFHEDTENQDKLILEASLLKQRYLEKEVEVENLQREVAHLTKQIGSTHDERERIASNAVLEVSSLRVDKAKLENALQQAQAKVKSSEKEINMLQLDSKTKVQELIIELSTSKNNHEILMGEHEKMRKLMDNVKSSEQRYKSAVHGLELKLSASEYEKQQQVEEVTSLKVQLQKISYLQDEISSLKSSLNEIKFEKTKVEASLESLSEEFEELKTERNSLVDKISSMQNSMSEIEDCRSKRVALEEKLLRLEGDLTVKDALCAQDAELKNELNRTKRANSQMQRKIQCLEDEKIECLKKAQALKEELKMKKEGKPQRSGSSSTLGFESDTELSTPHEEFNLSEADDKHQDQNGVPETIGVDFVSKIQLLEIELAEALEANEMYKEQLKKLLNEGQNGHAHAPKRSISEGVTVRKTSSLEAELKDIRERYFHMSLQFAEVEAEREELVMKLKSFKSGKRWFS